jgi:hypothetical protein
MSAATIIVPASNAYVVASTMEQSFTPAVQRLRQKFVIFFPDIKFEHTIYRLHRPIELILEAVDGGWLCQEKILSLSGFGKTSIAAVCSVFEDFAILWKEIAQAPDSELSEEAQVTKHELLDLVRSVNENS